MENTSEETHSNKNSLSISSEESDGFAFGLPPHSLEDVQAKKKNTHKLLRSMGGAREGLAGASARPRKTKAPP